MILVMIKPDFMISVIHLVLEWLEQDIDVNTKLYLLSTYMGHNHPEDTYWYLSATPELLDMSSRKYENIYGGHDNG